MDVPILDIECKWNHITGFFHLMLSRFIQVVECLSTSSFLVLNHISLYGYTMFHLSIHQLMGHWIVSIFYYYYNATMNIHVQALIHEFF